MANSDLADPGNERECFCGNPKCHKPIIIGHKFCNKCKKLKFLP